MNATFLYADKAATVHGLNGNYYSNNQFAGTPLLVRKDSVINFNWINAAPSPKLDMFDFSVRWKGFLKAPADGDYYLDAYGSNFQFFFNDSSLLRFSSEHGPEHKYKKVHLKAGMAYPVQLDYSTNSANAIVQFNWEKLGQAYEEEAISVAKQADVVVMFMGLSPRIEGEEMDVKLDGFNKGDRTKLALPAVQEALIKKIATTGKPVVLVLLNGSALAINWEAQNIPAIVETWYGGQQGGTAIADVLTGKYNPAGRLPVTFYTSEAELPAFTEYNMKGRTYRYYKGKPLYEFGYGLSYTRFDYTNIKVPETIAAGKAVTISADVQNTGMYDGEEVVQLYLTEKNGTTSTTIRSLKGFCRVYLKKGEKKNVVFTLQPKDFSHITNDNKRVIEPGVFQVSVGGKQPTTYSNGTVMTREVKLNGYMVTMEL